MSTERWEPDAQLIDAVIASPRCRYTMGDLAGPDRAWVVAGLTLFGMTAEEIAARLSCSLRQVRTIRADPMTAVCMLYQRESSHFADELRLSRSESDRVTQELNVAVAEAIRLRRALAQIAGTPTCSKCGEPLDKYNLYVEPASQRRRCRNCHRIRQRDWRAQRSSDASSSTAATRGASPRPPRSTYVRADGHMRENAQAAL